MSASRLCLLVCLAVAATGCASTYQEPLEGTSNSGFLGDYSKLEPGEKGEAALRYVNPDARWTGYDKVMIDPVTFWGSDATKVPAADQQTLCDYMDQALREKLGEKYTLVDRPGPGVMRLQVAITDATTATPVLRTISVLVPQAALLNNLQSLATGSYAFAGSAQVEARLIDASTGQLLGEWVDRRMGGNAPTAGAQWQWGDVKNAMEAWASLAAERLSGWSSGATKPAP
ncbi:MAG TPA: DUF3313 domain-containing protein [Myxococcota bacterium]|jgi:hypothetical protein|nr:DUF3313 domain-containing protein [Myxococcota bacterium]